MSAVSARRCDARQIGLSSRRDHWHDRRGEERRHRAPRHVAAAADTADTTETRAVDVAHSTLPPGRREQVGAFYAREASRLRRIVATRVRADAHTIDDACAHAWERLSADPGIVLDRTGLAWLAKVAIREGWRLSAISRREFPGTACATSAEEDEQRETARPGFEDDAVERAEHHDRLKVFQTLKCRERRDLFLQALGYRYDEIAAMTGSSYTSVNRRLAEGRAQLRRRREAASGGLAAAA
jgi:DNA-directed RNA polymerase specialized sigma24 family protein